ncbi:MAG TPA: Ig domain-containing protein [Chloroflexota bacterium]|nr:Ig domain-containing protein [Chloroflexota bacterium]
MHEHRDVIAVELTQSEEGVGDRHEAVKRPTSGLTEMARTKQDNNERGTDVTDQSSIKRTGKARAIFTRPPQRLLSVLLAFALGLAACTSMMSTGQAATNPAGSSRPSIAWGSAHRVEASNNLKSVSCPAAYFCAAVDDAGNAFTFDGRRWKTYHDVDSGTGGFGSVACVSAKSCWAADSQGFVSHFDGRGWSAPASVDSSPGVYFGLACPTATFCAGADGNGSAFTHQKGRWRRVSIGGQPEFQSIGCSGSKFCMAGDSSGDVTTWNGAHWSGPHTTPASASGPYDPISTIACLGSHMCVAGTVYGGAEVWRNGHWSAMQALATNGASMVGAACFAGSTCFMVDGYGEVFTWRSGRWTKSPAVDPSGNPGLLPNGADGLSCASPSFCAATNNGSEGAYIYFRSPVPDVTTGSLPGARVGRDYKVKLHVHFGLAPYRWQLRRGGLPKGLKLGAKGAIRGKPAKAGTFRITVAVTDPLGQAGTRKLTLSVKK